MKYHFHRETTVLLPWDNFIDFCLLHLYTDTSVYDPWDVLLPLIRPFYLLPIILRPWKLFLFQIINMFSMKLHTAHEYLYYLSQTFKKWPNTILSKIWGLVSLNSSLLFLDINSFQYSWMRRWWRFERYETFRRMFILSRKDYHYKTF